MKSFIHLIEKKIKNTLKASKVEVIDNTSKHKGHKFFQKDKLHLKIIIESKYLKSLNKVEAHKKVMKVLEKELKDNIHALELKIN
tara:strand:+ start:253 stop:507 length:255 start_codon:yes stop_codon:yes gene_type:complete